MQYMLKAIGGQKMKFEVKNRYTGNVQFVAEIDCDESAEYSIKLGLAVKWGVKAMADLSEANLYGANLSGADDIPEIAKAQTLITPEGDIVGWKKCQGGVIVKMLIPSSAKRHNATGRKCRAEYADVMEVVGAEVGISKHDGMTEYRVGQRVTCDKWGEDRFEGCAGGIHFFITRIEAENY